MSNVLLYIINESLLHSFLSVFSFYPFIKCQFFFIYPTFHTVCLSHWSISFATFTHIFIWYSSSPIIISSVSLFNFFLTQSLEEHHWWEPLSVQVIFLVIVSSIETITALRRAIFATFVNKTIHMIRSVFICHFKFIVQNFGVIHTKSTLESTHSHDLIYHVEFFLR